MNNEEVYQKVCELKGRFVSVEQTLPNRINILCEPDNSYEISRFLFEDVPMRFVIATAQDTGEAIDVTYHFSHDPTGIVVNLKILLTDLENPEMESFAQCTPAAEWIEREMHDLLGINFVNHPRLERLILQDDWPEGVYPYRKGVLKELQKEGEG